MHPSDVKPCPFLIRSAKEYCFSIQKELLLRILLLLLFLWLIVLLEFYRHASQIKEEEDSLDVFRTIYG